MGKVLSGELSCPCDRSCFFYKAFRKYFYQVSYGIGVSGRPGTKQQKTVNQTLVALIYIPMKILTFCDVLVAQSVELLTYQTYQIFILSPKGSNRTTAEIFVSCFFLYLNLYYFIYFIFECFFSYVYSECVWFHYFHQFITHHLLQNAMWRLKIKAAEIARFSLFWHLK